MSGIITLEDGSDVYGSNLGLDGTFKTIADAIRDTNPRLARWLADIAQRPGGMMDLDLRGLSADDRASFWFGVDRAHEKFSGWDQDASFSPAVGVIRLFYERRDAPSHFVEDAHTQPIDLDDLWFTEPQNTSSDC